jgi:hypothetical protein
MSNPVPPFRRRGVIQVHAERHGNSVAGNGRRKHRRKKQDGRS